MRERHWRVTESQRRAFGGATKAGFLELWSLPAGLRVGEFVALGLVLVLREVLHISGVLSVELGV